MKGSPAPIAVFAYNRPAHFRACIASLAANPLAAESDLFVYSDAPKGASAAANVDEVRRFTRTIQGFRSVRIVEQNVNLGLSGSVISGVSQLVRDFGRAVVVEDDLVVAPDFLRFMNDGLDAYADDARVGAVHGYMFPVQGPLPETFFLRDPGCWGWATWRRAWDLFEPDGRGLREQLINRGLQAAFDYDGSYPYLKMLEDQIAGVNNSWAIRWYAALFLCDLLTLYPGRSLVQNIGHDGSGVHGSTSHSFDVHLQAEPIAVGNIAVEESALVRELLIRYLKSLRPHGLRALTQRIASRLRALARV